MTTVRTISYEYSGELPQRPLGETNYAGVDISPITTSSTTLRDPEDLRRFLDQISATGWRAPSQYIPIPVNFGQPAAAPMLDKRDWSSIASEAANFGRARSLSPALQQRQQQEVDQNYLRRNYQPTWVDSIDEIYKETPEMFTTRIQTGYSGSGTQFSYINKSGVGEDDWCATKAQFQKEQNNYQQIRHENLLQQQCCPHCPQRNVPQPESASSSPVKTNYQLQQRPQEQISSTISSFRQGIRQENWQNEPQIPGQLGQNQYQSNQNQSQLDRNQPQLYAQVNNRQKNIQNESQLSAQLDQNQSGYLLQYVQNKKQQCGTCDNCGLRIQENVNFGQNLQRQSQQSHQQQNWQNQKEWTRQTKSQLQIRQQQITEERVPQQAWQHHTVENRLQRQYYAPYDAEQRIQEQKWHENKPQEEAQKHNIELNRAQGLDQQFPNMQEQNRDPLKQPSQLEDQPLADRHEQNQNQIFQSDQRQSQTQKLQLSDEKHGIGHYQIVKQQNLKKEKQLQTPVLKPLEKQQQVLQHYHQHFQQSRQQTQPTYYVENRQPYVPLSANADQYQEQKFQQQNQQQFYIEQEKTQPQIQQKNQVRNQLQNQIQRPLYLQKTQQQQQLPYPQHRQYFSPRSAGDEEDSELLQQPVFTTARGVESDTSTVTYRQHTSHRSKSEDARRHHSPVPGASEHGYQYGGMDFIDHAGPLPFRDEDFEYGQCVRKSRDELPLRRPGDHYGLDFSTHPAAASVSPICADMESYHGYAPRKPRQHWKFTADPEGPFLNNFETPAWDQLDPTGLVGDTLSNQKIHSEPPLSDEEREKFCVEYAPPTGFRPEHRTVISPPIEAEPICMSLSAKKDKKTGTIGTSTPGPQSQEQYRALKSATNSAQRDTSWYNNGNKEIMRNEPNWSRNIALRKQAWEEDSSSRTAAQPSWIRLERVQQNGQIPMTRSAHWVKQQEKEQKQNYQQQQKNINYQREDNQKVENLDLDNEKIEEENQKAQKVRQQQYPKHPQQQYAQQWQLNRPKQQEQLNSSQQQTKQSQQGKSEFNVDNEVDIIVEEVVVEGSEEEMEKNFVQQEQSLPQQQIVYQHQSGQPNVMS